MGTVFAAQAGKAGVDKGSLAGGDVVASSGG
jgi:hypothetical protein